MISAASGPLQSKEPLPAPHRVFAVLIGVVAAVWLVWLSGWLGAKPDMIVLQRQNVLFNSDTYLWVGRMFVGGLKPLHPVHPLQYLFWSRPCRALAAVAGLFLPRLDAQALAARCFVAAFAGTGIALLAWLGLRNRIRTAELSALFVMYLLFTSSVTICLPEHFGISNGLLTMAFVAPLLVTSSRVRLCILGILTVLLGGTTVTNALFPMFSLIQSRLASLRQRLGAIAMGSSIALGAGYLVYRWSVEFQFFVRTFIRWRFVHDPLASGAYLFYFLVSPAIGPRPLFVWNWAGLMVSYEPANGPLSLANYAGVQVIGAIAWAALLGRCALEAYRTPETRPAVKLLLAWLLFNCVLHNVWGDELLLFAPHWSWALMSLVLLGAPRLSRAFVVTAALLVISCQIPTLIAIKQAVELVR
jgi:hypothetical protein